ncbi:MAG: lipopolysaccharide biosynthesis protein [Phycisphaerae bacterium]
MRNLALMLGGRLATQCVLIVSAFVIPRLLAPESYGHFAALMAVVAIVHPLSVCGLPLVEMRYLAPAWQEGRLVHATSLASSVWTARLGLSVVAAVVAALWLAVSPTLATGASSCVYLGLLALFYCASEATRSLFLSVGRPAHMSGFELVRALLALPVIVVAFRIWGVDGAIVSLGIMYALLFVASCGLLYRAIPVRPRLFKWSILRRHVSYSLTSFTGGLAGMIQVQFAVYALATWVTSTDAAFLGISVRVFAVVTALFVTGQEALMPVLAELESRKQMSRLRYWGGVMLRYGAALSCLLAVAWALLGKEIVRQLLTDAYAPVYACVAFILVAAVCSSCATSCNALLYVRGFSMAASGNMIVYAAVTVACIGIVVREGASDTALRISLVYTAASALFLIMAYLTLGRIGGTWLPLGACTLLVLPSTLVWPITHWEAPLSARICTLVVFVLLYVGVAVRLRLLPLGEIQQILQVLRHVRPHDRSAKVARQAMG